MRLLNDFLVKLPAPWGRLAPHAVSLLLGVVLAVLLDYVLYRVGLPSKPFIYAVF